MNQNKLIITFLSCAGFVVGCNKQATTSEQFDQAKAKTAEAAQELKEYSYAQKSQFVEKMQWQLAGLDQDLDQLSAKLEKSGDSAKAESKPKLQLLRDDAAKLNKQLEDVKSASESSWDSVKRAFNKAYESSSEGVEHARLWISDKVAP